MNGEQSCNAAQKIQTYAYLLFGCVQNWRSETRLLAARSMKSGRTIGGWKAAVLANNAKGIQIASQAGGRYDPV